MRGAGQTAQASAPREQAFRIDCDGAGLAAVLHRPPEGTRPRRGVVIVVGGPQTRIGSHRQFLLLARDLAAAGFPVLRFDVRGMGDSDGEPPGFEALTPDISAAVRALEEAEPSLEDIVLWGLCDAASAIMMNAWRETSVSGVVLLNPWVRTDSTQARAVVRHYYARRILHPAFWRALFSGRVDVLRALTSFFGNLRESLGAGGGADARPGDPDDTSLPFPLRMRFGMERFGGRVLLILSGNDLTAAEFRDLVREDDGWRQIVAADGWERQDLPEATHTFSSAAWRDQVSRWTRDWLGTPAAGRAGPSTDQPRRN